MSFLDKNGLQVLTTKLVQGDAIKVASHRGHTVKNVIDNITRECENISTPNTMTLENRVNEFKVGKGRDVDVSGDIEEGKIEVGLEGRTFQNLLTNMQPKRGLSYRNGIYTFEASKNAHVGFNTNNMLKNNTTYSIIIEFLELPKNIANIPLFGDREYGTTKYIHNPIVNKKYVVSATTRNTPVVDAIYLSVRPDTIKENIRFKAMLLEGDYTQTPIEELPKYFEGIKSSFEDGVVDVEVQGKNLFYCDRELTNYGNTSYEKIPNGYRIKRDTPGRYSNSYIVMNLKPNTKYLIHSKYTLRTGSAMIIIKDKNNDSFPNRQEPVMLNNMVGSFVTPDDGVVRLGFACTTNTETVGDVDFYDILLQEYVKSSYSPYEPYYKKKISFNIGEPLRSLPNGICDEIRNSNGQWELVRRIGHTLLVGTENWINEGCQNQVNTSSFRVNTKYPNSKANGLIISDKLQSIDNGWSNDVDGIFMTSYLTIRLTKTKLSATTPEGVKAWFSNNNTNVFYELETPVVTPIEPIGFEVKPLATITINSDIAPTSNHKVILNRAGQIEQGIVQIAELKSRVDALETAYDSYLLETQHKLSILGFEYELESEEV